MSKGDTLGSNPEINKKTHKLIQILIDVTTSTIDDFAASDKNYRLLKSDLLSAVELKTRMPDYLVQCTTLAEVSKYIKDHAPNKEHTTASEQRRSFIERTFQPVTAFLYGSTVTPADKTVSEALAGKKRIYGDWEKALQRRATDPEGAITMARTLLESTFKQVLDEKGVTYPKDIKLPELYFMASKALDLHPTSTTDTELKKLLGACNSFVVVLGEFRNDQSDSHGRSETDPRPERRFAELAVNLAGPIASIFISTLEESAYKL